MPERNLDEIRQREIQKLESYRDDAEEVIGEPGPTVVAGKGVVRDEGVKVPDKANKLRAIDQARKLSDSIRKATGIDADPDSADTLSDIWTQVGALEEIVHEVVQLRREVEALRIENYRLRTGKLPVVQPNRQLGY